MAPFQIGSVLEGGAVGVVVDSADDKFRVAMRSVISAAGANMRF
ncbi:hypothetical protein [Pseudomonas azerbaijanoccidentalis]